MKNADLLQELQAKVESGEIKQSAVLKILQMQKLPEHKKHEDDSWLHFSLTKFLYALGVIIVIIGVVALYAQIWDDLSSIVRVIATLGLGAVFAGFGSYFLQQKINHYLGLAFHIIGGFVLPIGAFVSIHEFTDFTIGANTSAAIFCILTAYYLALTFLHKHLVFTFFTIANATIFIYSFMNVILNNWSFTQEDIIFAYVTTAIGVSYILLTQSFSKNWNEPLTSVLYFVGTNGIIWSLFYLVFESTFWEFVYIAVPASMIYLGLTMKSKSMVFMSTIGIIAYIAYITGEYFADSIGWPISLVFLGFVFIGLGYYSVHLTKKYI